VLSKETHETVIRFAPPLTITQDLIDRAVDILEGVVMQKRKELAPGAVRPQVPDPAAMASGDIAVGAAVSAPVAASALAAAPAAA